MKSKTTATAQVVGAARWTLSLALALGCLAATGWFAHPGAPGVSGGQSAPIARLGLVRVIAEEAEAPASGAVGAEASSALRQTQPEASPSTEATVPTADSTVITVEKTAPTAEQTAEVVLAMKERGDSTAALPDPQAGNRSGPESSSPVSPTQDPAPAHPQGRLNGRTNDAVDRLADSAENRAAAAPAPNVQSTGRPDENTGEAEAEMEATQLDAGFALRRPVRPGYPPLAKRLGKRGRVRLELGIDTEGRVYRVNVRQETGGWGFGAAAAAAYRQARFTRPTVRGRPVRVLWRKTIIFRP